MSYVDRVVRTVAVVALATWVLGVGLAACSSGSGGDEPAGQALVIGDSLTVGADTMGGLGDEGDWAWTVVAKEGWPTAKGIEAARRQDVGRYDVVVVALGTNDYEDSAADFAPQIDEMMAALSGAKKVLWVNVDTNTAKLAPAADGVNAALVAAADRHPNLEVADWDGYVAGRDLSEQRAGDGVHYDPSGYRLRARWMEHLVSS